jgi:FAD/FMN-containing dehydrogenase/Fe-S oxidoreductase
MLPTLSPDAGIDPLHLRFIDQLLAVGFAGDIDTGYAARLSLATDNSAFQQLPSALLFPRHEDDIAAVCSLLAEDEFREIYLAPRGGGTSTIGCSLTAGLVLDCSRHMNRILEIDIEGGRVCVQPGVVLDQLNHALAPHGLFFAPNVAPSSRATLGGMASTDGCGKGSRVYGKTSDHVLASRLVLSDGSRFSVTPRDERELALLIERRDLVGHIHREVAGTVQDNRDEIARVYPKLSRYLSGYNLAQLFDDNGMFNLNKLLCGAEGTLAIVSELTLRLTPLPSTRTLFALRYASFDAALRDAQRLVTFDPTAIESLDDTVMGLARDNPIYERVRDYIENADGSTPAAVNLVEFTGVDALPDGVEALAAALAENTASNPASGFYRAESADAIAALWDLRKGGVGLLGSTPGDRKPLPFVEDTVVDPRVLPEYVADFRAILDEYGLRYGMFGHIDVGCLHVRPALNLCDPEDERIMREITDRVAKLAQSYGGMLWNEHGKGHRSEYHPAYFGPVLYAALGRVKRAFDPRNQFNPGKIVALDDSRAALASMNATTRGAFDRQIAPDERHRFQNALNCNGNGSCFNYDPGEVMCPSYRATRDRLHSPKGRAGAMREWLRQLALADAPTATLAPASGPLWLRAATDYRAQARAVPATPDFSHEVWAAMDGCLSCRACATQCPIRVNVPDFKARFLALYHGRYSRPLGDYALGALERGAQLAGHWPRLANRLLTRPAVRHWLADTLGLVDMPALSAPSLPGYLRHHPNYRFMPDDWLLTSHADRARTVFIIQDAFTSFFDAGVAIDILQLIERLGFVPRVVPFMPSGKPLQVKGFLPEFERRAQATQRQLEWLAGYERPMIGLEPSITLAYADDYPSTTGRAAPQVNTLESWLVDAVGGFDRAGHPAVGGPTHYALFNHCIATARSSASNRQWQQTFSALGIKLSIPRLGCCGMSGAYGHEARHRDISATIYSLSWQPAYASTDAIPLVPGYSCRSQSARLSGFRPQHPASALLSHLR